MRTVLAGLLQFERAFGEGTRKRVVPARPPNVAKSIGCPLVFPDKTWGWCG
jgi:hypothetical protein